MGHWVTVHIGQPAFQHPIRSAALQQTSQHLSEVQRAYEKLSHACAGSLKLAAKVDGTVPNAERYAQAGEATVVAHCQFTADARRVLLPAQLASAAVINAPYGASDTQLQMVVDKPTPALTAAAAFLSIGACSALRRLFVTWTVQLSTVVDASCFSVLLLHGIAIPVEEALKAAGIWRVL